MGRMLDWRMYLWLVTILVLVWIAGNLPGAAAQSKVVYATTDIAKGTMFGPANLGLRTPELGEADGACTVVGKVTGFRANRSIARNQVIKQAWLTLQAQAESEVWVAKVDIPQGASLSSQNAEIRRLPSSKLPPSCLGGLAKPEGRQTRIEIRAGEPITETMLFSAKPLSDINLKE